MNEPKLNPNQNQTQTMITTTALSEVKKHFGKYLENWDATIATHDDKETQNILLQKLIDAIGVIERIIQSSDLKAMTKARGTLIPGSNEANEKEVLAMVENQKKTWYKEMKNVSLDINYCRSVIVHIYELKNRKTDEIFMLRAENAELRNQLEKLKK